MKKALLMTWFNTPNYGTLLQCDATVSLFKERYNIVLDVANYNPIGKRDAKSIIKKILSFRTWKRRFRMVIGKIKQASEIEGFRKKQEMVNDFIRHYSFALNGNRIVTDNDFKELNEKYDVFVSGSDQIWNPDFLNERYLLDFVDENKQCISVSSSISKREIDEKLIEVYKKSLCKYLAITVREEDSVKLIEKITGMKAWAILDPTLLYGSEGWQRKQIKNKEKDYVLAYILGTSEEIRNCIVQLSSITQKDMYYFPHMDGMFTKADAILGKRGKALWGESPYKWIGWISNATLIITDSFHMTVFSIMLHRDFLVVPKEENSSSQNNRILNILRKVGLEDRFIKREEIIQRYNCLKEIDWNNVDNIINKERNASLQILDDIVKRINW